jgi:hypothetical protein
LFVCFSEDAGSNTLPCSPGTVLKFIAITQVSSDFVFPKYAFAILNIGRLFMRHP